MGLLDKFRHKGMMDEPSYDDVRSHVLGQEYPSSSFDQQLAPMAPPPRQDRFGRNQFMERYPEAPTPFETPGLGMPEIGRQPIAMEKNETEERTNFEILDRLAMIEAQLAAIRSQTETINERLKNIDARLPRRY
jgi:hypothetical protein